MNMFTVQIPSYLLKNAFKEGVHDIKLIVFWLDML